MDGPRMKLGYDTEPWNPLLSLPHAYLQQKRALGGLQLAQASCCLIQKKLARLSELVPSPLSNLRAQVSQGP